MFVQQILVLSVQCVVRIVPWDLEVLNYNINNGTVGPVSLEVTQRLGCTIL